MKMDLGRMMSQGLDCRKHMDLDGKMNKGLLLMIHQLCPCALKACIPDCTKKIFSLTDHNM